MLLYRLLPRLQLVTKCFEHSTWRRSRCFAIFTRETRICGPFSSLSHWRLPTTTILRALLARSAAGTYSRAYSGLVLASVCWWYAWKWSTHVRPSVYCSSQVSSQLAVTSTSETDHNSLTQIMISIVRFIYLMILFTPALILHVTEFLFPFKVIRSLKWYILLFSIQQAGPAFIKLAQWASTRPDILSDTSCDYLSKLQRHCSVHSWQATCQSLEANFGPDWEDKFVQLDRTPIGSGCVAQVYKWDLKKEYDATIVTNTTSPVAVKVLHPGIVQSVLRDIRLMAFLAQFIDTVYPLVYWVSLRECVGEFGIVMMKQLDLTVEACSMDLFRENFRSHEFVKVPRPVYPLVTKSVLVETFEEGIHVSHFLSSKQTLLHKQIATLGIDTLLHMIFVHNFIHCDMHPGNLLIQLPSDPGDKPTLVLLDCGVTTSLSKIDWTNLSQLFLAVIKKEGHAVADLMLANASFSDCKNIDQYRQEMASLVAIATQQLNLSNIKVGNLLSNLFKILVRHKVKLESNFVSVILAVMILEGLGRSLDPQLDILTAAKPFLLRGAVRGKIPLHQRFRTSKKAN